MIDGILGNATPSDPTDDFEVTNVRQAPSFTNPSMWRCVPGSDFFSPHHCHPGDLLAME